MTKLCSCTNLIRLLIILSPSVVLCGTLRFLRGILEWGKGKGNPKFLDLYNSTERDEAACQFLIVDQHKCLSRVIPRILESPARKHRNCSGFVLDHVSDVGLDDT